VAAEITSRELRRPGAAILRRVDAGETFVITERGAPIAELRPISRRRFVTRDQIRTVFEAAPPIDHGALRRDIDRHVC
jgi:antitoxin (DNA-binding transcriptional repressor) of toxin-antitoxin stability system